MNASFLLLGITTSIGALLLRSRLLPGPLGLITTALFIASGIGIAMVGLNPENLQIIKHIVGAYLNAYGAFFAIILAGICLIKNEVNRKVGLLSFWTGIMGTSKNSTTRANQPTRLMCCSGPAPCAYLVYGNFSWFPYVVDFKCIICDRLLL